MKRVFIFAVLIMAAGFAVYANSLQGELLWDDEGLVLHNPYIKDWKWLPALFTNTLQSGKGDPTNFYRPLQMLSYMADYSLWRLDVVGYHLANVFWHIAAALALFWLLRLILKNDALSFLTALFFVVHPVHTEAVAYVAGRADPMAAAFMFSSFALYLRGPAILAWTVFFLALLCRESALILPGMLLIYHAAFKKSISWKRFAGYAVTAVVYLVIRQRVLTGVAFEIPKDTTALERLPGFFIAIVEYLKLLFVPHNLHMEYGGILFPISEPKAVFGILILAGLVMWALWSRKRAPLTFFCVSWFVILLLPYSNLYVLNAYMAEHWLYLPSAGFFILLAGNLLRFKKIGWGIAAALVIFYSFVTIRQNTYWRTSVSLYKRMLELSPYSSRLYNNLAKAYHDAGQDDKLVELLEKAIRIEPQNIEAHINLGNALKHAGRVEESIAAYKRALEINPNHPGSYHNLGVLYKEKLNNPEEAVRYFKKSLELNPHQADTYFSIGLVEQERGNEAGAIEWYQKAVALDPDNASIYHGLGAAYIRMGRKNEAIAMYENALRADPQYASAYHDLAVIYYSDNQFQKAVFYLDQAIRLGLRDKSIEEALAPYRS